MKVISTIVIFLLSFSLDSSGSTGTIYSFEDGHVPSDFKAKSGTLTIQDQKAKLGTKSLQWNWIGGDKLSASPANMRTASIQKNGGINVWIYNEKAIDDKLTLWFYEFENIATKRCNLQVNLNFAGWRCVQARFRDDMGHTGYTLRHMEWEAPDTGTGVLLIDYLEFVDNVSWERISDKQYAVNNPSELEDFLQVRNIAPTSTIQTITDAHRSSIQTIKNRINEWHLGNGIYSSNPYYISRKEAFDGYVRNALNKTSRLQLTTLPDGTVQGPGLYPLYLYGRTIDNDKVLTFREINEQYLMQLAFDAVKNGNAASQELIFKIFDWYYEQGWADGSGLGQLRFELLRSSGFFHASYLMLDLMDEHQADKITDALKWFTLFGEIYKTPEQKGENSDKIRTLLLPKLFIALTLKDEKEQVDALAAFSEYTDNALSVAGGYLDCIKPDYSGYHHRGPYFNAYFPDALYAASLAYYYLSATEFALSDQTYQNLKNALLTFRFSCADYEVPGGLTGRFPAQTQVLEKLLPAFAYLALSSPQPDQELASAFMRLWEPNEEPLKSYILRVKSDITFKTSLGEIEKMIELASFNIGAEENPVGSKFLPYAGLYIARQQDWMLTIKGFSKYIWDFEASSSENLYGRYLSYGHMGMSKLGSAIRSYHPENSDWDWSHLPGTTAKYLTKQELNFNLDPSHRNFSANPFLGGCMFDQDISVFSNIINDPTFDVSFRAKKSVFQIDNMFYCMGSGINSKDNQHEVHTTLFQNLKLQTADHIVVNKQTVSGNQNIASPALITDNYGCAYVLKQGNVNLNFGPNFISAYTNHGQAPSDEIYGYWIVPDASDQTIQSLSQETSPLFEVLSQDNKAHAIYYKPKKTLSIAVFDASAPLNIKQLSAVNLPCIIIMQERDNMLELAFTDPDMHRPSATNIGSLSREAISAEGETSSLRIELNGYYEMDTPNSDITAKIVGDKTVLEHSKTKGGSTYKVQLIHLNSALPDTTAKQNISVSRMEQDSYVLKVEHQIPFDFFLYQSEGKLLSTKKNIKGETTVSLNKYPPGIYILRIKTANAAMVKKLIR